MRIIVTGGAGFIGSAVCRLLMSTAKHDVLNIDKLTHAGNLKSLESIARAPNYHFLKADICDAGAMQMAFRNFAPDAIIHLAAESHVDRSISGSRVFIDTNIIGTYTLLETARAYLDGLSSQRRGTFRFVMVSTDEVYGSAEPEAYFSETSAYDPSSPYSASKAASDHLALAWHRTYGLPVILSNCSNNYGPFQFPEKLIPLMIMNAMNGMPLPVYGDGSNVRDWLYVDDHAKALLCILERGRAGRKYNVGGGDTRSNLDVVRQVCSILDRLKPVAYPRSQLISFVADRPGHDQRYAIDASRIESELGWRAEETFESGLAKTVAWYLANSDWWLPDRG